MAIWTDAQISKWAQEAENEICLRLGLIIDRIALPTTEGQSNFVLPDYVNSIRRLTFQGFKIDPSAFLEVTETLSSPGRVISSSRPLSYVYNGFGKNVIKVFPSVGITTAAPSGDLFNSTAIALGMIAEVYRAPDFSTSYNRIPDWFRRIIVKAYVVMQALAQEGPGQDLKGSAYFKAEFEQLIKILKDVNSTVFLSRQYIMGDSDGYFKQNWRAHPMLPPNYPIRRF